MMLCDVHDAPTRVRTAKGKYYEAQCIDVDPVRKVVKCQYSKPFKYVEYKCRGAGRSMWWMRQ